MMQPAIDDNTALWELCYAEILRRHNQILDDLPTAAS